MSKRGLLLALAGVALLLRSAPVPADGDKPYMLVLAPETLPYSVSSGGFVSAGSFFGGGGLYWMPTSGTVATGGLVAIAVSRDGKTIAGTALDSRLIQQAAIWQGGRDWRLLGGITPNAQPCDRLLSGSFGANGDGTVVVGLAWDSCRTARAFRWEESTGMVSLGSLGGDSTRANAVSADGRVVVGWEEHATGFRQAAKWVDRREELIKGPTDLLGEALSTNHDGSIIVGTACNPYLPTAAAWMWTAAAGVTCLPVERPRFLVPPHPYQGYVHSTSDDGRVMGGSYSFGLDSESLLWLDGQVYFLRDYLRQNGLPDAFDGWVNTGFVTDVSPDGRTLVGYGAGPRTFQGFMVLLPKLPDR
jgi:probable HAF family extracellular repeat protein